MTETPPPEVELQAVPPNTAYSVDYITLSNVRWTPAANAFTVRCDTDVACLLQMDYWSHNDPSIPQPIAGTVAEGGATTTHTFTTPALPAGDHTGKFFGFSLRKDATDATGKTLRSQQGFVQLIGARTVAKGNAVNVRWNSFAWNRYTWAQYGQPGQPPLVTP